jgi:LacI family transcriptional regulator
MTENDGAEYVCPYCKNTERQVKAGMNGASQRYKCGICGRRYSLSSQARGYSEELHSQAETLRAKGMAMRQIARTLGVNHQSVANWLPKREQTANEHVPPSTPPSATKRRAAISDVARQAGVSVSSVSNYLNDKGRMADTTRQRIQSAMDELHFTPSALVRAIRHQHTNILGVLIPGLGSLDDREGLPLTIPLLRGINDGADAAGNDLLLYTGWPGQNRKDFGLRFLGGHIDGLLWMTPMIQDAILEYLISAELPVMALMTRHVPDRVGYVNADNIAAMRSLVEHLAERGHKQIAYLGPAVFSNFVDRHAGYRMAIETLGLPWEPSLQVTAWPERTLPAYLQILDGWLALQSPPTAIMCATDTMAALMAAAIQTRGLRIPQDMALTGFDDDAGAEHIAGGLTTIRQPFREMGRLAAEALLALIGGGCSEDYRLIVPVEIVVRASTLL